MLWHWGHSRVTVTVTSCDAVASEWGLSYSAKVWMRQTAMSPQCSMFTAVFSQLSHQIDLYRWFKSCGKWLNKTWWKLLIQWLSWSSNAWSKSHSSSWSRASSRGVVDTLLALHSQKKGKDKDPWLFLKSVEEHQAQCHQLRLSTIDLQNKMVNWNLPCWAPFHPDPSLIIITYCLTAIQICSRMGGPFYGGFTFFRLYLIAQSLGLFCRKPPVFWILA